jgi:hypothetical protein
VDKRPVLTRVLAIVGTIIVWLPLAAPVALALAGLIQGRGMRFDYLMPAELFPAAMLGGAVLLWAANRARSHRGVTGWSLAAAVGLLVGSMALAVVTGLASGATEPTGWPLILVAGLLAAYALALVVLGVAGVSLVRTLFGRRRLGDSITPARS